MIGTDQIRELKLLDQIEEIEEKYESKFGVAPVNLSTWDPKPDVISTDFLATLPPITGTGKNYIFSYYLNDNAGLRAALGYTHERWRSLVSHSGSANIVLTCNWLRCGGARKILILGPRYFTVPHCLDVMGIKYDTLYFKRNNEGFQLPKNLRPKDYDGIWVTNPVYGTGVYIPLTEILKLQQTWSFNDRYFILDECLASPNNYYGPNLSPHAKTTILAAPHKSICVNAYKFAISIFEQSQLEHFEQWSDVFLGCLPQSSFQAIEHIRSNGFLEYFELFQSCIKQPEAELEQLTSKFPKAMLDQSAEGYFRTVYFQSILAKLGYDIDFLYDLIFSTGTSVIPNIRNELDPQSGFSFRVNLAAFNVQAKGAYVRLAQWLSAKC